MKTYSIQFLKTVTALLALSTLTMFAEKKAAITHSFLGVGKANRVVIVGEEGKVQWRFDMPASDGWVLPGGNVLLAVYPTREFPKGGVAEVDYARAMYWFARSLGGDQAAAESFAERLAEPG